MTDFDLLLSHAQQPMAKFQRFSIADYTMHGVPGQNVAFWIHPHCMSESYPKERFTVRVCVRVPSTTFWGKLFKKQVWREISLTTLEQEALHPYIHAISERIDALNSVAAANWRSNTVKSALAMPQADFNAVKEKANEHK